MHGFVKSNSTVGNYMGTKEYLIVGVVHAVLYSVLYSVLHILQYIVSITLYCVVMVPVGISFTGNNRHGH